MASFGVHIEMEGRTSEKVQDAFDMVQGILPKQAGEVQIDQKPLGGVDVHDTNIATMNTHQSSVGYAIDLVDGYEGDINKAVLDPIMKEGRYSDLPDLIKPKSDIGIGYDMSLAILPQADNKHLIVKLFLFFEKANA